MTKYQPIRNTTIYTLTNLPVSLIGLQQSCLQLLPQNEVIWSTSSSKSATKTDSEFTCPTWSTLSSGHQDMLLHNHRFWCVGWTCSNKLHCQSGQRKSMKKYLTSN